MSRNDRINTEPLLSTVLRYVKHNIEYGDGILQLELGPFEDTSGAEQEPIAEDAIDYAMII